MIRKATLIVFVTLGLFAQMATGEETGSREEQTLRERMTPAKIQLFTGTGMIFTDGNAVADVHIVGAAAIYPFGKEKTFFLRPYASTGVVYPEKHGADSFQNAQAGVLVGYKATKRFSILAGASVTVLFPESGTEYRETINLGTATILKKLDRGALQLLTPVSFNQSPNGNWNTVAVIGIGWVF